MKKRLKGLPRFGDCRQIKRFALSPMTVTDYDTHERTMIWLEHYIDVQVYESGIGWVTNKTIISS